MDKLAPHLEPIGEAYMPSTQADVARLQTLLGAALPQQYIDFLLRYGRCGFAGDARLLGYPDLHVLTFFGTRGEAGNVLDDLAVHEDYVARKLVPIADDMFNHRYVLHAPDGGVSFLYYAAGQVSETIVATSFGDFLDRIQVVAFEDGS